MTGPGPLPVTLCTPPRPGELCAPVRFELRGEHNVLELTSRHRVTGVEVDDATVVVVIEITDPALSRPVHVRFSVLDAHDAIAAGGRRLAEVELAGAARVVIGTYLGVASAEN